MYNVQVYKRVNTHNKTDTEYQMNPTDKNHSLKLSETYGR